MARWAELEAEAVELAAAVRERFDAHGHKILATLRRDGSPRLSGMAASFRGGDLWLAGMPGSRKFLDLRRDPRLALHSASEDPDRWRADAKVAGRGIEVTAAEARRAFAQQAGLDTEGVEAGGFHLFHVDLTEAVLVRVGEPPDHLVIESWHEGVGVRRVERR